VTILLVGEETKNLKHIDWEVFSSMYDGKVNKKSGILVINIPGANAKYYRASHAGEKERIYPETKNWTSISDRKSLESRYPNMPARLIDNMLADDVKISSTKWEKIENDPDGLDFLIDATFKDRAKCDYDMGRAMRRANS
jgi:hypothetical protein